MAVSRDWCDIVKLQPTYLVEVPWKIRKLILWRYLCATWLCCLVQYLLLALFLLWLNLGITDTSNWMGSVISQTFCSFYTWVAIQPLFLLLACYGLFLCHAHNVQPGCYKTCLERLTAELPGNLLLLAVLLAAGSYQAWLYLSYGQSNAVYYRVGWYGKFLLIYGGFCGLYYFVSVQRRRQRLVELPVVRLRLHVALNLIFWRCLNAAMWQVVPPTICFAAIYWPWTAYINHYGIFDGFWVLLEHPKMIGTASCLGIFIIANFHMVRACYALILNRKLPLVIKEDPAHNPKEIYLHTVLLEQFYCWLCRMVMAPIDNNMGMTRLEITFTEAFTARFLYGFQLQAAKDFFELMTSPTDEQTKQMIQLTGLRNTCKSWPVLCNTLLEMLTEFATKMEQCLDATELICPKQETVAQYLRRRQPGLRSLIQTPPRFIYSHGYWQQRNYFVDVDLWELIQNGQFVRMFVMPTLRRLQDYWKPFQWITPIFESLCVVDKLYLLRHELLCAQPLVWTMQGLVNIFLNSLQVDNYGVLQEDLPRVLEALLDVEQQLCRARNLQLCHPLGANYALLCNANARCLQQLLSGFAKHLLYLGVKHAKLGQRLAERRPK